ncbi:MAG: tRNA 2-selenouridine(34) synthase MnmH [Chitinophagaceae bacterium]
MPLFLNTFTPVSITRVPIKEFLVLSAHKLIVDVRSPGEYEHAHMPRSVNLPLFTNEERKVVGTAYKQESREIAIKAGLDFFGPKMRLIVEEVEKLAQDFNLKQVADADLTGSGSVNTQGEVFLFCWRGGMRSAAVAWLLALYGFSVVVLAGGYKAYRNYVLQLLSAPYSLIVLGGYTGSGKTEVLYGLKNRGSAIIDLEGLAQHKGSAFGNIGMPPQPTQEMFENLLAVSLSRLQNGPIWVEDESQRIGLINIPATFWKTIRSAPVCFLEIGFEERLEHITEEYGAFSKEDLSAAIQRISKRLGGLETKNAFQYLQENNYKECFRILLTYYDKHYLKGLHNREELPSLLTRVACDTVSADNASFLLKHSFA